MFTSFKQDAEKSESGRSREIKKSRLSAEEQSRNAWKAQNAQLEDLERRIRGVLLVGKQASLKVSADATAKLTGLQRAPSTHAMQVQLQREAVQFLNQKSVTKALARLQRDCVLAKREILPHVGGYAHTCTPRRIDDRPFFPFFLFACWAGYTFRGDMNQDWRFDALWAIGMWCESLCVIPQLYLMNKVGKIKAMAAHAMLFWTVGRCCGFIFWYIWSLP